MSIEPGIYNDIPDAEYHSWELASKSRLWKLRDRYETFTREEWLAHLADQPEPSYDLVFGRFFDDLVSWQGDRERIESVYAPYDAHKTACKAYFTAQESADKVLILADDFARAANMLDSINRHPLAAELMHNPGRWQTSIVWDDERTGVRCKGRIDRVTTWHNPDTHTKRRVHVDVKTTKSAIPAVFNTDARNRGYWLQAAHYIDGTRTVTGERGARDFAFLVVEKDPIKSGAVHDRHDVKVFHYAMDGSTPDLEDALRIRDSLLEFYHAIHQPDWKPTRTLHRLSMPYQQERDHEHHPVRRTA